MSERSDTVRVESRVERKDPRLPRFVVVPEEALAGWILDGTTVVLVEIDDADIGRRTLKTWSERGGWFFDLTETQCALARVDTGDPVAVTLRPASTAPPKELIELLRSDADLADRWASWTVARRRQIAEHVRAAKRSETRRRRARKALAADGD